MTDQRHQATWGRAGAAAVEEAAREVRRALLEEDSAFATGSRVWTVEHAQELLTHFNGQPDIGGASFDDKLKGQLSAVSPGAIRLFAELYYLDLLPLSDYKGTTKRALVESTLLLAGDSSPLPTLIDEAFDHGVLNGGVAFKTRRYWQLCFLVEFAAGFLAMSRERRAALLDDPLAFRDALAEVTTTSAQSQRATLLYLFFPDFYLPIANSDHRARIRKAFADKLPALSDDPDQDLHDIYQKLVAEAGQPIDLYVAPFRDRWDPTRVPDITTRRAWLVRGNVNGQDLVPGWRHDGIVTVAASSLREVESGISKDELRRIVDQDYDHVSYEAREDKLDEFHSFLNRMQEGHLVVTIDRGIARFGDVVGGAEYVAGEEDPVLQRAVVWRDLAVSRNDLPADLRARLASGRDVLDVTQQLDSIDKLLAGTPPQSVEVEPASIQLPDATPELAERLHVPEEWLQECVDLLRDRPQLIFYGPPGTGKTYIAQALAEHVAGENVRLVQFHPSYSYEDFFEGFRPAPDGGFKLKGGPMRRIVDQAIANPREAHVLIIDEINRGNLAKVFGELYFLLEYRDRSVELLYGNGDFTLPANVFLIGTMNTADRSIALVDAAMRRRFAFLALHPSEPPTRDLLRRWLRKKDRSERVADLLEELNARIDDPDFKIGPSYLMRDSIYRAPRHGQAATVVPVGEASEDRLERVWRTSILPLLGEHHYGEMTPAEVAARYGYSAIAAQIDASSGGDVNATP